MASKSVRRGFGWYICWSCGWYFAVGLRGVARNGVGVAGRVGGGVGFLVGTVVGRSNELGEMGDKVVGGSVGASVGAGDGDWVIVRRNDGATVTGVPVDKTAGVAFAEGGGNVGHQAETCGGLE